MVNFVIQSPEIHRDLEFAWPQGTSLRMDASIPAGSGPHPAVIVVHGGGWVRGDRRVDVAPLLGPLTRAGFAWFSIDYRLTADWSRFGEAVDDVEAALRFVRSHSAAYRIDPGRVALVGESAGGQLAAMAGLRHGADPPVRGMVAIYTPFDLLALARNSSFVPPVIRDAVEGSPFGGLLRNRLTRLSPIENVRRGMPPFLLIHGTSDPLVPFDQSLAMRDRMLRAGADCELFAVPGAGHGLRWWEGNPGISEPYKQEMARWLRSRLQ